MIKKVLLILTIICNVYSAEIDDLKTKFTTTIDKVIVVVKDKKLLCEQRNDKIVQIITPMFDFELMAKLSLGKSWKTLDKATQEEFVDLYVQRMKKSYSSKIDKYTDEKIIVNDIKQTKKTRIVLNTSLVGDSKTEVIYKYYKPKKPISNKDLWLVYDVIIAGVSIIKTDKAQFKEVLKESSIDALMDKLR